MSRSFMLLILSGAILLAGLVVLTFFGGNTIKTEMPGMSTVPAVPVALDRPIRDFTLTNQAGAVVTRESLLGRPWAVNLIFTRCPGPCTQLTGVMKTIQEGLPPESRAGLFSLTSDPEFDSPKVLSAYAEKFGAKAERWSFGTGTRGEIWRLATQDLMLALQDVAEADRTSPEDLFLHSTLIILVDKEGRVRSFVEGLEPGAKEKALEGLARLEGEP